MEYIYGHISKATFDKIKYYYEEIFEKGEIHSISEMVEELDISERTLHRFRDAVKCNIENSYTKEDKVNSEKLYLMILLSTKFKPNSDSYIEQVEILTDVKQQLECKKHHLVKIVFVDKDKSKIKKLDNINMQLIRVKSKLETKTKTSKFNK